MEQVGAFAAYPSGVAYLVQVTAPSGAAGDDQVISILRAQDDKFEALKSQLGLG